MEISKITSHKPHTYFTHKERRAIVEFYELHDYKVTALQIIRATAGYEHLTDRKIKRWMNALGIKKSAGRPVCEKFEAEVLVECEKCVQSTSNYSYSYAFVRDCAHRVLHKSYLDKNGTSSTKKWLLDKRTCHLKFTNKWVSGLLRRSSSKRCSSVSGTSSNSGLCCASVQSCDEASDVSVITSGSDGGSFDDFAMDFDWDLLRWDDTM